MTKRRLRPPAALAMVALIGLTGAGCSSGSAESGATATAGPGAVENAPDQDEGVRFAACMREHGVTAFPDPDGSSDQELVETIQRLEQGSAAWKPALAACKDLRPPGLLGGKATAQEMRQRLAFARCIRDNGVEDFPDPIDGEPLVDTNRIPSADRSGGMSILNAAMRTCAGVMGKALGGR